jgi:radical SAM superfamily enzyme YgiQ (UPF0313 family)
LAYIAAVVRQGGFDVVVIDQLAHGPLDSDELIAQIIALNPLLVGISTTTPTWPTVRSLACTLKETGLCTPIIVGGHHATFCYQEILQVEPAIDFVGRYECEYSTLALAKALRGRHSYEHIPGIAWRHDAGVVLNEKGRVLVTDLDKLPLPARDLLSLHAYSEVGRGVIVSSRGCPYACVFCSNQAYTGGYVRRHSVDRLVAEIRLLASEYDAQILNFSDDSFPLHRQRVEALCRRLQDEGPKIQWSCMSRVDCVDRELLALMADSGCTQIFYGTESGDQQVLDGIGKKVEVSTYRKVVDWTKEAGIRVILSVLIGLPGQTERSLEKSLDLMRDLAPDGMDVSYVCPQPGTPLWDEPQRYGIRIIEDDYSRFDCRHVVAETALLSAEQQRRWYLEAQICRAEIERGFHQVGDQA